MSERGGPEAGPETGPLPVSLVVRVEIMLNFCPFLLVLCRKVRCRRAGTGLSGPPRMRKCCHFCHIYHRFEQKVMKRPLNQGVGLPLPQTFLPSTFPEEGFGCGKITRFTVGLMTGPRAACSSSFVIKLINVGFWHVRRALFGCEKGYFPLRNCPESRISSWFLKGLRNRRSPPVCFSERRMADIPISGMFPVSDIRMRKDQQRSDARKARLWAQDGVFLHETGEKGASTVHIPQRSDGRTGEVSAQRVPHHRDNRQGDPCHIQSFTFFHQGERKDYAQSCLPSFTPLGAGRALCASFSILITGLSLGASYGHTPSHTVSSP